MDFLAILGCETHFKCAKITTDRPGQAARKIFSIECRFQRPKSRPSTFKETCTRGHQRAVPPKSRHFTIVGQSSMKAVADRHAYDNKH